MRNLLGRLTGHTQRITELEDEIAQWRAAAATHRRDWATLAGEVVRLRRERDHYAQALDAALSVIDQSRRQLNLRPAEAHARSVRDKLAGVSHNLREVLK